MRKVKAETAAVMATEAKAKRELAECQDEIAKMQRYAEKALTAGSESDARRFLEKKGELAGKQAGLQQAYDLAAALRCARCTTSWKRIWRGFKISAIPSRPRQQSPKPRKSSTKWEPACPEQERLWQPLTAWRQR